MRYRPVKKPAPMPENPYHRIFTPMPSFEDLVRKAREEEKTKKKLEIRNEQLRTGRNARCVQLYRISNC